MTLTRNSEADIIDLLEELRQTENFGLILVTHNLELAKHAQRVYEMRQGTLVTTDLPEVAVEAERRPRHFEPIPVYSPPSVMGAAAPRAPILLGSSLVSGVTTYLLTGAAIFGAVLIAYLGVGKYQDMQVRDRAARIAKLAALRAQ